jgi:hypothetical protein
MTLSRLYIILWLSVQSVNIIFGKMQVLQQKCYKACLAACAERTVCNNRPIWVMQCWWAYATIRLFPPPRLCSPGFLYNSSFPHTKPSKFTGFHHRKLVQPGLATPECTPLYLSYGLGQLRRLGHISTPGACTSWQHPKAMPLQTPYKRMVQKFYLAVLSENYHKLCLLT